MSRDTDKTPHIRRMPMLERIPMPWSPIPTSLRRNEHHAMDAFSETVAGIEQSRTGRSVPPGRPLTISRAFEAREGKDSTQSAAAYRNFLHYTRDVVAASLHYPGGMTALIGHREEITIRLVRLLGVSAHVGSL